LPIPSLRIDDEALGQPRQPVPRRLVRLATGLIGIDSRDLLAVLRNGDEP